MSDVSEQIAMLWDPDFLSDVKQIALTTYGPDVTLEQVFMIAIGLISKGEHLKGYR